MRWSQSYFSWMKNKTDIQVQKPTDLWESLCFFLFFFSAVIVRAVIYLNNYLRHRKYTDLKFFIRHLCSVHWVAMGRGWWNTWLVSLLLESLHLTAFGGKVLKGSIFFFFNRGNLTSTDVWDVYGNLTSHVPWAHQCSCLTKVKIATLFAIIKPKLCIIGKYHLNPFDILLILSNYKFRWVQNTGLWKSFSLG